ncbi:Hypothetical predicted protein [Mytilus galloprovincialis]|uniref:Uncharacterized protein n=1 Tax=Mytilus galloprovincialis TaxID=29158 RepID=A0A8B6DC39_MYTGA|nr:Hypothetical predicted protein [Mytilus galloprovincialis]
MKQTGHNDYNENSTGVIHESVAGNGISPDRRGELNSAKCVPSQKIKEAEHDIWVCVGKVTGEIGSSYCTCTAGKIPLKDIISREIERLNTAGVMRFRSNEAYDQLSLIEITEICKEYHIDMNNFSKAEVIDVIKKLERTRKWKMWHDHSDILNHTYINFMVSLLYDPANFLTDDEYIKKNPQKKAVIVQ